MTQINIIVLFLEDQRLTAINEFQVKKSCYGKWIFSIKDHIVNPELNYDF